MVANDYRPVATSFFFCDKLPKLENDPCQTIYNSQEVRKIYLLEDSELHHENKQDSCFLFRGFGQKEYSYDVLD